MQRVTRMWRPPRLRKRKAKNQAAREAWSAIPRIRPYLKGQWRLATASTILLIFSALFALLEPWPLALLIDGVLGNEPPPSWLTDIFGDGRFTLLGVAVGLGFIVTAGIHGLAVLSDYVNTKLDQRMVLDFRSDLFRHSHKLSFGWHSNRSTGQLMNRINFMASSIGAVTMSFPPMAESVFTIIGMFIVAFTIDSQLTLLAMTVVPFVYYSIGRYTNRVLPDVQRVKAMEGQNLNIVHEAMSMIRVIVAFGRERHEYRRFRDQGERTVDARVRVTVRQTLFSMAVAIITAAGTGLVLWFGASNVLRGRLSVGQLLVVISYIAAVYTPLQGISSSFATLQEQVVGLQMSFGLLDIAPEVKEKPNATAIGRAQGHVTFDNVSFSYRGRKGTLRGVSFEAKPGEAIALVGPTGGGKSTLVSLIPRFYDPEDGRILLDGHDLSDLTLGSLRRQISIVLQEPQLFSGTIEDNIRYGHLEASEDEVVRAAKAANAHDFIVRLPKKYK
ncbi:MAG: ABC transporter ATP-binding protein, partial [Actinomycetota bacterium]